MTTTVDACLAELREKRARLDEAIESLEKVRLEEPQPGFRKPQKSDSESTPPTPQRQRAKRGRKPKVKPNGSTTMSAALTCMQCSPPREFETAIGKAQHMSWRHTGRKGAEKSLVGSSLSNG